MSTSRVYITFALLLIACGAGCATTVTPSESTEVATEVDPASTQPTYWYDLAALSVSANDFDRLWHVAEETARDFGFALDRVDYRAGVLTTVPLTSAQWFEPWRTDIRAPDDWAESSVATVRRTIRFEFTREPNGLFKCYPKVLVERQAMAEQRITSATSYQGVYRRSPRREDRPRGTRESDEGVLLPSRYWYSVGRDQSLEAALIDSLNKKLRRA